MLIALMVLASTPVQPFPHVEARLGPARPGWERVRLHGVEGEVELGAQAIALFTVTPNWEALKVGAHRKLWDDRELWAVTSRDAAEDGEMLAQRLSATHGVAWAVADFAIPRRRESFEVPPNDPRYEGQWYLKKLQVEGAWRLTAGDPSVAVAVIDNGCESLHPDLAPNLLTGFDAVDGDDVPEPGPGDRGRAGNHGTACAGLVGAVGNNALGITGVCPQCKVRCIRLMGASGNEPVPMSADVDSFNAAKRLDVAVVSNSWSFARRLPTPPPLKLAIEEVSRATRGGKGAVVLFAAGNENSRLEPQELYSLPEVVTVGAVTNADELTSFSNRGEQLDFVTHAGTLTLDLLGADGDNAGDYTNSFGGTSSACPVAAGVAGLVISAAPSLTSAEVRSLLQRAVRPAPFASPNDAGHDESYGYGILSAEKAVRLALGLPDAVDAGAVDSGVVDAGLGDAGVDVPHAPDGVGKPTPCGCSHVAAPLVMSLALAWRGRRRNR